MIKLTQSDKHHWGPVPQVMEYLRQRYAGKAVLDVGPGHCPLPWATRSVDFVDSPGAVNLTISDVTKFPLPFQDKEFDFVFCRHMLEDMWNPFPICKEMERVGRAGYIETPSPMCELTRGVDGNSPNYRGYFHHRFFVWTHKDQLRFVTKYPLIEHMSFAEGEDRTLAMLRSSPKYWNTYYLWEDTINVDHRQAPLHFEIMRDYGMLLRDAMNQSIDATNEFWTNIPARVEVPSLAQAFA